MIAPLERKKDNVTQAKGLEIESSGRVHVSLRKLNFVLFGRLLILKDCANATNFSTKTWRLGGNWRQIQERFWLTWISLKRERERERERAHNCKDKYDSQGEIEMSPSITVNAIFVMV